MNGKEKMLAALSAEGTAEVPAVICYESIYVRDHWDQLTSCPWWYGLSGELEHQLAWRREVLSRTPQDWFHVPPCPTRARREATIIEERPHGVFEIDRSSGEARELVRPAVSGQNIQSLSRSPSVPDLPETIDQVDAMIPPAGEFDAGQYVADGRADLAKALTAGLGRDLFSFSYTNSPLWKCYHLWGFEGMMVLIADRPDLVSRACERHLHSSIAQVRQAAALGAGGVWIEECLLDMISPAAYESLNVPVMRRLIQEIRSLDMKSIYYFCGKAGGNWKHILRLGMDALALEESKKGFTIDIEKVAEEVGGRFTLFGNLDAVGVLQDGSDDELRTEIARQLAAGRTNGSRFVMSLGSPVTPATGTERVRLYCELVHELS